jgi:hypothetical protein
MWNDQKLGQVGIYKTMGFPFAQVQLQVEDIGMIL